MSKTQPGGQLRYRVQPVTVAAESHAERPDRLAERLVDAALAAGVRIRTNATVAGCFAGLELLVIEEGVSSREAADAVIVATGSTDLPYPFAGATYPGVFSARGLQILLNLHRVRPGRRFAIIGGGADAEELAVDVMLAGGEVVWSGIAPAPFLRADGAEGVRGLPSDRTTTRSTSSPSPSAGRPIRPGDDGRDAARVLHGARWPDPADRRPSAQPDCRTLCRRRCRRSGERRRGDCRRPPRRNRGGGVTRSGER